MSVEENLPVDRHPERRLKASFKVCFSGICFWIVIYVDWRLWKFDHNDALELK